MKYYISGFLTPIVLFLGWRAWWFHTWTPWVPHL